MNDGTTEPKSNNFSLTDEFAEGAMPVKRIVTVSYEIDPAFLEKLRAVVKAAHQSEDKKARNAAQKSLEEYIDYKSGVAARLLLMALLKTTDEHKGLAIDFLRAPFVIFLLSQHGRSDTVLKIIDALKEPADQAAILSEPGVLDSFIQNGGGKKA